MLAVIPLLATQQALCGHDIVWPDVDLPIPAEIEAFIVAECEDYEGTADEDVVACILGESLGYRAVVMMLTDAGTGPAAAERYRACRAGLGAQGGRFHRRRAECIGHSLGLMWRFVVTQRAAIDSDRSIEPAPRPSATAAAREVAANLHR